MPSIVGSNSRSSVVDGRQSLSRPAAPAAPLRPISTGRNSPAANSPGERRSPVLAVPLTGRLMRLAGTDASPPRCGALGGTVGKAVSCTIYDARPSPAGKFEPHHTACSGRANGTGWSRSSERALRLFRQDDIDLQHLVAVLFFQGDADVVGLTLTYLEITWISSRCRSGRKSGLAAAVRSRAMMSCRRSGDLGGFGLLPKSMESSDISLASEQALRSPA